MTDADPDGEALVSWLGDQEFRLVADSYSERDFGNWWREFHADNLWVLIVRERGHWSVSAAPPGSGLWFSMSAWNSCLDGNKLAEAGSWTGDRRFLRESLDRMCCATKRTASLGDCLRQAEGALVSVQLVSPPPSNLQQGGRLDPTVGSADIRRDAAARLARGKRLRRNK